MKVKVIIPASGSGERFGGRTPKQFLKIDGKEIIVLAIEKFHSIKLIDEIIISAQPEYFIKLLTLIKKNNFRKVKKIVEGGKTRQDSVYNALLNLECEADDIVLVHDSVRPFISSKKINELINETKKFKCVIPGMRMSETLKKVDGKNFVTETIDRKNLWTVQTPQAFTVDILKKSFDKAYKAGFTCTDESSVAENAGYKVRVIEGEKSNIKITVKEDLKRT
ncbi:MAG: 2-C-methyl-D-erythritol 4-phosphate cytidylyltransferase [Ignavibacteria bacterium]